MITIFKIGNPGTTLSRATERVNAGLGNGTFGAPRWTEVNECSRRASRPRHTYVLATATATDVFVPTAAFDAARPGTADVKPMADGQLVIQPHVPQSPLERSP
ncbi:hypothetical protein [Amycolatopsis sp. CA-230715]|uniref:hypothetical protein n=1 Tax=Amycolatopsis sp. CA-230715 TaxID=2745196 RepID=UPI001C027E20|nr:hypothetical protein [Amycolatopsis sp. CA-230715]QWF79048.1 hypothetical protein HUW46_02452 [Amycolatopsis sp. CA-230715]